MVQGAIFCWGTTKQGQLARVLPTAGPALLATPRRPGRAHKETCSFEQTVGRIKEGLPPAGDEGQPKVRGNSKSNYGQSCAIPAVGGTRPLVLNRKDASATYITRLLPTTAEGVSYVAAPRGAFFAEEFDGNPDLRRALRVMNDLARRSLDGNSHCCRTGNRQGRFPPHQPMAHAAAAEGARQLDARPPQSARSTIFRTGRLLTPSMPVSSSALAARPPQPSWRIRARKSRSGMAR